MGFIYLLTPIVIDLLFVLSCQCAPRILLTQTKEILELTIIDIKIDTNCRKNKITVNLYTVPLFLF